MRRALTTLTLMTVWLAGCAGRVERRPWLDLANAWSIAEVQLRGPMENPVRWLDRWLLVPLGADVDFFLTPPADSVLRVEGVHRQGIDQGWIEVWARLEGETEEDILLGRLDQGSRTEIELPPGDGRLMRLRLRALPEPGAGIQDVTGMVLASPVIAAPVGEDLPEPAAAPTPPHPAPGPERPNVLIYLIDTLRADHLGCYGHDRPVSPAIDAFARDALLFEHAVAQSSWTRPSVASLFTGVWPGTHGVHDRPDTLAPEALTLAEILQQNGYRTAGFVTNRNVARAFGFAQGFDSYRMLRLEDTSAAVHQQAVDWLDAWRNERSEGKPDAPFFLYLHTVEPHASYDPPEPFRTRFAPEVPRDGTGMRWWMKGLKEGKIEITDELVGRLLDLYDAEIAANDESFGRLIEWLRTAGLLEETVIVLVSDHGEEFHERGRWEHGKSLHTELVEVPLIVRFPGPAGAALRGKRVATLAQHIDVVPTLLDYLGLTVPPAVEGRDLLARVAADAPIFSHLDLDGFEAASVTAGVWRLIEGRSAPHGLGLELYDRRQDPRELENLAVRRPVRTGYLRTQLIARELHTGGALQPGKAVLDEETEEQLRALGYLR